MLCIKFLAILVSTKGGYMAKCAICGKRRLVGANVSHAHNVTKKYQKPNLRKVSVTIDRKPKKIWICAKCLKAGKADEINRK